MAGRMEEYARAGYLTAAIDCRYHGDRAVPEAATGDGTAPRDPRSAYQDSLVRCARLDLRPPTWLARCETMLLVQCDRCAEMNICAVSENCCQRQRRRARLGVSVCVGRPRRQPTVYRRAWRGSGERPFLLDNVWDLQVSRDNGA